MVIRRALPDEHHVMRWVPANKRYVGPDGERQGPSAAAFEIRPDDNGGLSVTEVEHFGPMSSESRVAAAAAHRESLRSKRVGPQSVFAWAQIQCIRDAAAGYGKTVRVVHDPVEGNPGHAEIRHFTDDDLDLLDRFTEVFADWIAVADMDLPPRD